MATGTDDAKLDPLRLSVGEAARLLGVDEDLVEQDVADGLPTNADGTLSLVSYAAWLNLLIGEDDDAAA